MTAPDPVTDVWELLWKAACDYRDAAGPDRSEARLIDALMPIVRNYGDRRAAQALEQAAGEIPRFSREVIAVWLRDRATNLRTEESA